jgi:3-oxoacyl-[acyl-carrier protein] reductase
MIPIDLAGKAALVTGASRGIGREVALRLAEAGAKVALVARTKAALEEVEAAIRAKGGEACAIAADVADPASVQAAVSEAMVRQGGRLDILVNNAGITKDGLLVRMADDDFDRVVKTNLGGTFLFTRAAARPMMKQRAGRIVNISSVIGIRGNPGQANYAASKAGIIGFTKSVARELASRGVTANVVAPGFVATDMTAALTEEQRAKILAEVPLGAIGKAAHVADAVLFLASPLAEYVTGAVIVVDGGLAM